MPKLTIKEKEEMAAVFKDDFDRIQMAVNKQLIEHYDQVRTQLIETIGIKESLEEVKDLEDEIAKHKVELQQLRERMQMEISQKERRLQELRETAVGDYSGPPSTEQLKELELSDHDRSISDRRWFGFPVRTKLDAEAAIKLKGHINVAGPIRMLEQIGRSIQRELAFAATHEAAKAAYEKFYNMNFRQFGVDIAPMLGDFGAVTGQGLLSATVEVETKAKGMLGSGKQE